MRISERGPACSPLPRCICGRAQRPRRVDIDPICAHVVAENCRTNDIDQGATSGELTMIVAPGTDDALIQARGPYDLLIANILAGPLVELAPDFADSVSPGGKPGARRAAGNAGRRCAHRLSPAGFPARPADSKRRLVDPLASQERGAVTAKTRALRWLGALAALPLVLGAVFLLAAWIGSSIPRNGDWTEPDDGIRIWSRRTACTPASSCHHQFRKGLARDLPVRWSVPRTRRLGCLRTSPLAGAKRRYSQHADMGRSKASTVLRILFQGGDGLIRVAHYVNPGASDTIARFDCGPTSTGGLSRRSRPHYRRSIPDNPVAATKATRSVLRHYDAKGRYTVTNTCNQWVGDVLAEQASRSAIGRRCPAAS